MNSDSPWRFSLWAFATAVYNEPEVEKLSLELQERNNANVNILLWAAWLQQAEIGLSRDVLDDVIATVESVSLVTVNRLRSVRRDIKEITSFTRVQSQMISKLILNAELAIEKVLLHRLQDMTLKFMEVMPDKVEPVCLEDYFKRLELDDPAGMAERFVSACQCNSLA